MLFRSHDGPDEPGLRVGPPTAPQCNAPRRRATRSHQLPGFRIPLYRIKNRDSLVRESGGFFMRILRPKGRLHTQSALYGAAVLIAASLFTQGVGFGYRLFLTRVIGAEGMGLFALIMSAYAIIMSLTVSGLTVTVSRLTAEYAAQHRLGAMRALLRRCFALFLGLWCVAALIAIPFSDPISVYLLGDARTRSGLERV